MLYTILDKIDHTVRYLHSDQINTHFRSSKDSNSGFCLYPSVITWRLQMSGTVLTTLLTVTHLIHVTVL